jgi:hypothetical protein
MNELSLWKHYLASQGPTRYELYLELHKIASSDQQSDEFILSLFDSLSSNSQSNVMSALLLLSRQALFQSTYYNSEILLKAFDAVLYYRPVFQYQLISSLVGFCAHEKCSKDVIVWSIMQFNIAKQTQQTKTIQAYLKVLNDIKKAHPQVEGIELLNELCENNL